MVFMNHEPREEIENQPLTNTQMLHVWNIYLHLQIVFAKM